jgi:hypothetical protein
VAYGPAGRETLDAITSEALGSSQRDTGPEIQVGESFAGRDTLAAIAEEVRPGVRQEQDTLPYADRISNAPGAQSPKRKALPQRGESLPEISIRQTSAGRDTMAAIAAELSSDSAPESPPASTARAASPAAPEIFEMVTFVVRGPDAARLSTEALRRRFAEEQLLHRLPVSSADDIDRVDVTPWTVRDTFVVRVWCRVAR